MRVVWTRPASRELEVIGDYIARESPAAADRTVNRILDEVDGLEQHPHKGRPGRLAGTRELVVTGTPFVVPYRVRDETVQVLSVFHGKRKWPDKFD
jgi:toxin ParE1/3/4